jgi:hypothetical protein
VMEAAAEAVKVAWTARNAHGSQHGHVADARTGWACGSSESAPSNVEGIS